MADSEQRNPELSYEGRFRSKLADMGLVVTENDVTIDNVRLERNENVPRSEWAMFWGALERRLVCRPSA